MKVKTRAEFLARIVSISQEIDSLGAEVYKLSKDINTELDNKISYDHSIMLVQIGACSNSLISARTNISKAKSLL